MANNRGQKPVVHTKKHVARLQRERQQTRIILGFFIAVLVVLVGLLVGDYVNVNFIQLQKPVAKVGDVELSRKDFQTRVRLERNNLLSTYQQYYQISQMFGMDATTQLQQIQTQLDDNQTLGQGVIDSMVNEELIRQEAAKRGITVTDAEVEAAVQGAFQYYPDGSPTPTLTATPVTYPTLSEDIYKYITPSPTMTTTPEPTSTSTVGPTPTEGPTQTGTIEPSPSPTITVSPTVTNTPIPPTPTIEPTSTIDPNAPTETPIPTSTPYTAAGFKDQYGKGLTHFAKYGLTEEQYRTLFKTDLLRQKLYDQVTADVSDVQDQVWARHILVADEASALAIIERLKNGEDFGKLASELSTDTGSAAQGGDLGWFSKGTMVAAFEDAAFSLKVGEISAPVKSDYGYHIIQVMARQTRPLTADELKTAKDAAFNKFLTTLRTTYNVQIMTDWLPYVPTDPSFVSIATEAAITQSAADRQTQQAK